MSQARSDWEGGLLRQRLGPTRGEEQGRGLLRKPKGKTKLTTQKNFHVQGTKVVSRQTGCSSWKQILLWLKGGVGKSNSSSNSSSSSSSSNGSNSSLPTLSPVLRLHLRANSVLHVSKNGLEARDLARFPRFVREEGLMLFTTVRHPFDRFGKCSGEFSAPQFSIMCFSRLVSAFENKILYRKVKPYLMTHI